MHQHVRPLTYNRKLYLAAERRNSCLSPLIRRGSAAACRWLWITDVYCLIGKSGYAGRATQSPDVQHMMVGWPVESWEIGGMYYASGYRGIAIRIFAFASHPDNVLVMGEACRVEKLGSGK
jgi:hypothetical protein